MGVTSSGSMKIARVEKSNAEEIGSGKYETSFAIILRAPLPIKCAAQTSLLRRFPVSNYKSAATVAFYMTHTALKFTSTSISLQKLE
jgi:hypothetical protein